MLSQQSMERVHLIIKQVMYEAINLENRYGFESSFFEDIIEIVHAIEDEFQPFLEARGESWERHKELVLLYVKSETENNRKKIKLSQETLRSPDHVRYAVISKCSSVVHELCRELEAKTVDREFRKTKKSLNDARLKLDTTLTQYV